MWKATYRPSGLRFLTIYPLQPTFFGRTRGERRGQRPETKLTSIAESLRSAGLQPAILVWSDLFERVQAGRLGADGGAHGGGQRLRPALHVFGLLGFDHDARQRFGAGIAQHDAARIAQRVVGFGEHSTPSARKTNDSQS